MAATRINTRRNQSHSLASEGRAASGGSIPAALRPCAAILSRMVERTTNTRNVITAAHQRTARSPLRGGGRTISGAPPSGNRRVKILQVDSACSREGSGIHLLRPSSSPSEMCAPDVELTVRHYLRRNAIGNRRLIRQVGNAASRTPKASLVHLMALRRDGWENGTLSILTPYRSHLAHSC